MHRLIEQNATIERLHRTVVETQDIGDEIVGEMSSNREKIAGAIEKGKEFSGMMDTADRTVKRMTKREWTWGFF